MLTSALADGLLEVLGIQAFLKDPMCSLADALYVPNTNNFKDGK